MNIYYDDALDRVVVSALVDDFAPRALELQNDGQYWVIQRSTGRRKVGPLDLLEVTDEMGNNPPDPVAYLNTVFDTKPTNIDTPSDILEAIAALDAAIS